MDKIRKPHRNKCKKTYEKMENHMETIGEPHGKIIKKPVQQWIPFPWMPTKK